MSEFTAYSSQYYQRIIQTILVHEGFSKDLVQVRRVQVGPRGTWLPTRVVCGWFLAQGCPPPP